MNNGFYVSRALQCNTRKCQRSKIEVNGYVKSFEVGDSKMPPEHTVKYTLMYHGYTVHKKNLDKNGIQRQERLMWFVFSMANRKYLLRQAVQQMYIQLGIVTYVNLLTNRTSILPSLWPFQRKLFKILSVIALLFSIRNLVLIMVNCLCPILFQVMSS